MSDTLAVQLAARMIWQNATTLDLSAPQDAGQLDAGDSLATGTGTDQADLIWHDTRSLASAASDSLDLTALTKTLFGSTVTTNFAKIKGILIRNNSAVAGEYFTVGNGTNPFIGPFGAAAHTVTCHPNGLILFWHPGAGWTVTNTTADVLKIVNSGAGVNTYSIALAGTSV